MFRVSKEYGFLLRRKLTENGNARDVPISDAARLVLGCCHGAYMKFNEITITGIYCN